MLYGVRDQGSDKRQDFICEHLLQHMEGHSGVTNLPAWDGSVLWVTYLVCDLGYSSC